MNFSDIDFSRKYNDYFIIYQSSEDQGLFYKSYIEDVCLFLEISGEVLIPGYQYLRAHHNKAFREMVRFTFKDERLKTIKSKVFGTYEDE